MNLRQASTYLGVSPDTLYRYVSEGVVPAFKLGNRWKLRKSVLDRWMESKMSLPGQTNQSARSKKSPAASKLVTANSD